MSCVWRSLIVFAAAVMLFSSWRQGEQRRPEPEWALVQEVEQSLVEALDFYADLQFAGGWTDGYSWPGLEGWVLLQPKWPGTEKAVVLAGRLTPHLAMNYLHAFETLERKRFLEVAQRTGDFLVQAQLPEGRWAGLYLQAPEGEKGTEGVGRDRKGSEGERGEGRGEMGSGTQMIPVGKARLGDESLSSAITVLVWLHRLTEEERYLAAASRAADSLVVTQTPCGGWTEADASSGEITVKGTAEAVSALVLIQAYTGKATYRTAGLRGADWLAQAQCGASIRGWAENYQAPGREPVEPTVDLPATAAALDALLEAYRRTHRESYAAAIRATLEGLEANHTRDGWARQYHAKTGTPREENGKGLLQLAYRAQVRAATWKDWGLPALRDRYHTLITPAEAGLNASDLTPIRSNQLRNRTLAVRELLDRRHEVGVWLGETAMGEGITLYDPPTETLLDYLELTQALRDGRSLSYPTDMRQRACPTSS